MKERGFLAFDERAKMIQQRVVVEPMPGNGVEGDPMVKLKRRKNGRSYHFFVPRSQVGQWMGAQA